MTNKHKSFYSYVEPDMYPACPDYLRFNNVGGEIDEEIEKYKSFSDDYIVENKDNLCWDILSENVNISESVMRKCKTNVKWKYASHKQSMSDNFIREMEDVIDWTELSWSKRVFTKKLIFQYEDKLNFDTLGRNQLIPKEILKTFPDRFNWDYISRWFPEQILETLPDRINWDIVSNQRKLTIEFMQSVKFRLNWKIICNRKCISGWILDENKIRHLLPNDMLEMIIQTFPDKIVWNEIFRNQLIYPNILLKFPHKINWSIISMNPHINRTIIDEFCDALDWDVISSRIWVSYYFMLDEFPDNTIVADIEFVYKYIDYLNWKILSARIDIAEKFVSQFRLNLDIDIFENNPHYYQYLDKYLDEWVDEMFAIDY